MSTDRSASHAAESVNLKNQPELRSELVNELLAEYPFITREAVRWGDMDALGHVNNTKYFRYYENVRVPMMFEMGFFTNDTANSVGPILASTDCRFKLPVTYPDTLHLGCRVSEIKSDRIIFTVRIVSEQHQRVAAEGCSEIVVYDYQAGKKAPMPDWLLEVILRQQPELKAAIASANS